MHQHCSKSFTFINLYKTLDLRPAVVGPGQEAVFILSIMGND